MGNRDIDIIKLFQSAALEVGGRRFDQLELETSLAELGLDSILVLEIVTNVERQFDLRFDDDELSRVDTMADLKALVERSRRAA